jgi:hypothetical protein
MMADQPTLQELVAKREFACRLALEHSLATLEEAEAFLLDRGMLTLTPDCALPSLFGACHEAPASGAQGFGVWPRSKWWWRATLAERPGVLLSKLHRGKSLYLSPALVSVVDPLCREGLARAEEGGAGSDAARLLEHLLVSGPSLTEDVLDELSWERRRLRALREHLEPRGIIVSRAVTWHARQGVERESSQLFRWDQIVGSVPSISGGTAAGSLSELLVAGVYAAVLAPRRELRNWFTWPATQSLLDHLLDSGQIYEPAPDWLAIP